MLQESAEAWLKIPEDRGRNTLSTALGPGVFPCSHPRLCYNQAREQPWPQVSTGPAAAHRGRRDKDREGWRAPALRHHCPRASPASHFPRAGCPECTQLWRGVPSHVGRAQAVPALPRLQWHSRPRPAAGMAVPKLARGSCSPSCLGHCSLSLVPG